MTTGDLAEALAVVTGEEWLLRVAVSDATRLEGDLFLDSVDLAALAALLRDRYGTSVDLLGYLAGLDIDQLIGLTVGDVAEYVTGCLRCG
jgi:acyl carrier protein